MKYSALFYLRPSTLVDMCATLRNGSDCITSLCVISLQDRGCTLPVGRVSLPAQLTRKKAEHTFISMCVFSLKPHFLNLSFSVYKILHLQAQKTTQVWASD